MGSWYGLRGSVTATRSASSPSRARRSSGSGAYRSRSRPPPSPCCTSRGSSTSTYRCNVTCRRSRTRATPSPPGSSPATSPASGITRTRSFSRTATTPACSTGSRSFRTIRCCSRPARASRIRATAGISSLRWWRARRGTTSCTTSRRTCFAPAVDNSYKWAGGGFVSSAEDLVKFGSALLQPGFLKPETLDLLFTSQRTSAGEETGYGIGWFLRTDSLGHRWAFHGGGSVGGTAAFGLDRDSRVVVAILANLSNAPLDAAQEIEAAFDH